MAESTYFYQAPRREHAEITLKMSEVEALYLLRYIDAHGGHRATDGPVTSKSRHALNGLAGAKPADEPVVPQ